MTASGFSAGSTTDDVISGVDLTGKVALVTGASAGLGVETSRALAGAGATVLMAARDPAKTEGAMARVRERVPEARLQFVQLELSDPASVRRAAEQVLAGYPRLDLLINNAGVMACPLQRTPEGWEWQMAVNHIGHFLLTGLLVPALLESAAPRVVNLSSGGHKYGPVDFDDPFFHTREYDKWLAYGQAKTANIWLARALHRRLSGRGLAAFAVHPGAIFTELGRHLSDEDVKMLSSGGTGRGKLSFKSIPQGAATSVWAATSPQLAGQGGLYLEDCNIGQLSTHDGAAADGYAPWAMDDDSAERLWQMSETWVGQQFKW
ncbi:MAG TPA: SDR family NAD(P)-dependent oxidoreductase [Spongiibacteraceae bacterium]|nr:SDR family NAD(P)-dependent oxidoreductase [Spongiibacteraceae bacterium]